MQILILGFQIIRMSRFNSLINIIQQTLKKDAKNLNHRLDVNANKQIIIKKITDRLKKRGEKEDPKTYQALMDTLPGNIKTLKAKDNAETLVQDFTHFLEEPR